VIQENGRSSKSDEVRAELALFAEDAPGNLRRLQYQLARSKFKFTAAKGVPIPKFDAEGRRTEKVRPIVLAPVASRIVQRAVLNVLLTVPALGPFVRTPYSFGGLRRERPEGKDAPSRGAAPSAVPAAIKAALHEMSQGGSYCASADIRAFFTRIPKSAVRAIVSEAVGDPEFLAFFDDAIRVELANMAALREKADLFPIEDIGVAQGNSLSPLLGNIILSDFDKQMNDGDCACIRYIDDFLILAPTERAANARLKKARDLLLRLGMDLSPEKSSVGARPVEEGFEFLGIQVCPGLIRPSSEAQRRLLTKIDGILEEGKRALAGFRKGQPLDRSKSFLAVLKRLDGTVDGWGKHYWFCNDGQTFAALDQKIWQCVREYLGCYTEIRAAVAEDVRPQALGIAQLRVTERQPFTYPSMPPRPKRAGTVNSEPAPDTKKADL
jgi:retron-type reverse transcriptase